MKKQAWDTTCSCFFAAIVTCLFIQRPSFPTLPMILSIRPSLAAMAVLFVLTFSARATVLVNTISTSMPGAFSVSVRGKVSAGGEAATFVFQYGTTTAYGNVSQSTSVDKDTYTDTQFTIDSGLVPNTLYHIRIKATGAVTKTAVYSDDVTFTTTAGVAVTQTSGPLQNHQPVSNVILRAGRDAINLSIEPDAGSFPFTFQWNLNGKPYGKALPSSYLNLYPVTPAMAGIWTCTVSNPVPSKATSPGVMVAVASITGFPDNSNVAVEGGTITPTVTLAPANAAATYLWHTESNAGGLPSGIGNVNGQGTNKLTISNVNANTQDEVFVCDVTVGSATRTLEAGRPHIALKPVIEHVMPVTLVVGQDVSVGLQINEATSATVSGLPAGLKYSLINGVLTGRPTAATPLDDPAAVVIIAKGPGGTSTYAFPITVKPLPPGLVGSWAGILDRGGDPTALGGKVTLTVAPTGMVTGTVVNGAVTVALNTSLTTYPGSSMAQLDVPNTTPAKVVNLNLGSDTLSGTVGSSNVSGMRNVWNTVNPVMTAGVFNCKFSPDPAGLADTTFPHGHSVAALTLTNLGAVTAAFHLADNTVVTGSTLMGADGSLPLYVPLYSNGGSVLGTPKITDRTVIENLSWNKNTTTAAVPYKAGFGARNLACTGGRYVKPNVSLNQYYLGLLAGTGNAQIAFNDGVLTSGNTTPVTVTLAGSAVETNADLTLTLATASGAISGSLICRGTDTATSKAVARTAPHYSLAIPGTGKAYGYFLSPVFTPSTSPTPSLSGIVEFGGVDY